MRRSTLLILTAVVLALCPAYASAALIDEFQSYLDQFRNLGPVRMSATLKIERGADIGGSKATSGGGVFEYWDDGAGRYWLRCATDRWLELAGDLEMSFDGVESRIRSGGGAVGIGSEDFESVPTAFPNPLLLSIDFLRPRLPECHACRFTLKDVDRVVLPVTLAANSNRGDSLRFTLPEVLPNHAGEVVEIWMKEWQDGRSVPVRVIRTTDDWISVQEFSDFRQLGAFAYPARIDVTEESMSGEHRSQAVFTIDRLVEDSSQHQVQDPGQVFDEDSGRWIKW